MDQRLCDSDWNRIWKKSESGVKKQDLAMVTWDPQFAVEWNDDGNSCLVHTQSVANMNSTAFTKQLTVFHFNDVYNIEPAGIEPVGGAARMVTVYKSIQDKNPMVLFSGDCLNPSMISSVEKGNQMLPVFEALNITCAVLGNHEFDFGLNVLEKFMDNCQFPWLLSNVVDKRTGQPLGGAEDMCILDWDGVKVGFLGLAEQDWLATLPTLNFEDMKYTDYVDCATDLSSKLREQGADIVIALTHMRVRNDLHLAECVPGVDIILGGHDHDYYKEQVDGRYVIKSGSDFQKASILTLNLTSNNTLHSVGIEEVTLDSNVPEDEHMKSIVDSYLDNFEEMTRSVLGYFDSDLDCLFCNVRRQETNLGNLIADIMVDFTGADVAIINSGTLRSNFHHPKGAFTSKDLHRILPLFDKLCVLQVPGGVLHEALENGVSKYPGLSGRFPQVSGIQFEFDPSKEASRRIDPQHILIHGKPLVYKEVYNVCVKEYIATGRDGYSMFRDCPVIVKAEDGPVLPECLQNFFEGNVMNCHLGGCLHRECRSESGTDAVRYMHTSHRQISSNGDEVKVIPKVTGRIKNLREANNNEIYIAEE